MMDTEVENTKTIKQVAAQWVLGQPFTNVLLLMILGAIGWSGYYTLTVAVPSHLKMIQTGYEKMEDSHRIERENSVKSYDRWLERIYQMKQELSQRQ